MRKADIARSWSRRHDSTQVVPKGNLGASHSSPEVVERKVFEEAGVFDKVDNVPIDCGWADSEDVIAGTGSAVYAADDTSLTIGQTCYIH
jgi:hypothetical protein